MQVQGGKNAEEIVVSIAFTIEYDTLIKLDNDALNAIIKLLCRC